MTNEEIIDVVTAHKRGAKIEHKKRDSSEKWIETAIPRWDFDYCDYRVAPYPTTPSIRPFTDDEVIQLIGAVAVSPDGKRGIIGTSSPDFKPMIYAYGEVVDRFIFAKLGWRWKWAHEDDCQLKPFGVVEGAQ